MRRKMISAFIHKKCRDRNDDAYNNNANEVKNNKLKKRII